LREAVVPLDPGRHWLEAGITGLPRQREWDAVATTEAPGNAGDEAEFVALPDGRFVVEGGPESFDPAPLAAALADSIARPYRAVALRREELWAVGARAIEVVELEPGSGGDDLELTWDGSTRRLVVDGMPADPSAAPALERLAATRERGNYAAHAHRLERDLWEVLILKL
jgi:hypothetical protein